MSHVNVPLVHNRIYYLTSDEGGRDWQQLLDYGETLSADTKRQFLWFWPSSVELLQVQRLLQRHGIRRVLSIGCGSGLLEWLLRESANDGRGGGGGNGDSSGSNEGEFEIFGLEVDRAWWRSAYAIKQFIDLNFVDNGSSSSSSGGGDGGDAGLQFDAQRMRAACQALNTQYALLFCYFNNRTAFLHYLSVYEGDVLLLIGPQPAVGIHTDPEPLQPHIPAATCGVWQLSATLHFGAENILALYKRQRARLA